MLQPLLQPRLLRRRKLPELRIVFQSAALLRRRQIFIAPQPISGVPRLILRRAILRCPTHRRTRWIRVARRGTLLFLKVVPLPVRILRFRDAVELEVAKLGSGRTTASPAEGRPDSSRVLPGPTCFYPFAGLSQPANHTSPPVETCRARLCPFTENLAQGVAVTSSCTCSSSSMSKSAYNSSFLSRACRSPTAVPGCTGKPSAGGFVGIVSA